MGVGGSGLSASDNFLTGIIKDSDVGDALRGKVNGISSWCGSPIARGALGVDTVDCDAMEKEGDDAPEAGELDAAVERDSSPSSAAATTVSRLGSSSSTSPRKMRSYATS